MTDIASLGLSVDSKPVEQGAVALDKLSASAKTAEQAARGFEQGAAKATTATGQLAQQAQRATTAQQALNQRLNVRDTFDTRAVLEHGMALDDLRAKINPLAAVERQRARSLDEINVALKLGAISQTEHSMAIQRVEIASSAQTKAIKLNEQQILKSGKAALVSGYQMQNLAFQINDVATMAAMGMDPLRILTSQTGQFYQVLAMTEGGPVAALKELGGRFIGLITPMRLLIGAGAAVAAIAVGAAIAWRNTQQQMDLALIGIAGSAGLTTGALNQIAIDAAAAGQATVGGAREMGLAMATTGRASEVLVRQALAAARGLGLLFGEDSTQSAERLARAMQDPSRAAEEWNKRLGNLNDTTLRHIRNLAAQGRNQEAFQVLLDSTASATRAAIAATDGWSSAWNNLSTSVSAFWARFQAGTANAFGLGSLEARIKALQDRIDNPANRNPNPWAHDTTARDREELERLLVVQRQIREETERAARNRDSGQLGSMIDRLSGEEGEYSRRVAELQNLRRLVESPGVLAGVDPAIRAFLDVAMRAAQARVDGYRTAFDLAVETDRVERDSITARTAAQRGEVAFRRSLLQQGQPLDLDRADPRAVAQARLSQAREVLAVNTQITEQMASQRLSAEQRTRSSQLDLSLVGATTMEQERQRGFLQNRQQLEAEALRQFGHRDAYDKAHLAALNAETAIQARNNQLARERQLTLDLQFERQQMIRTEQERQIYAQLRSAGMLDANGQIANSGNAAFATQMRLNQAMQLNIDLSREFFGGMARDIAQGKNAMEALTNAVQRFGMRILDMAMDRTISNFFAMMMGGGGSTSTFNSAGGWSNTMTRAGGSAMTAGPGILGGMLIPGILHKGGVVGAPAPTRAVPATSFRGARRYHSGGMPGLASDEVPAILQKGEIVLPKGWGGERGSAKPEQVIQVTHQYNFSPGMTPADMQSVRSQIEQAARATEARTVANIRQKHQTNSNFLFNG